MSEGTTITDGGSSPTETQQSTEPVRAPVFLDAPDHDDDVTIKPDADAGKKDEGSRYDKDPEFKKRLDQLREKEAKADELIKRHESTSNDQALKQLMDKISALESRIAAPEKHQEDLDFKPIHKMTPDEVIEWKERDPIGYDANLLKQFYHDLMKKLPKNDEETMFKGFMRRLSEMGTEAEAKKVQETAKQTIIKFADNHPDMESMVPEIVKFINENPGHNAISAYYELKGKKGETLDALKEGAGMVTPPIRQGAINRGSVITMKRRPGETDEAYVARRVSSRLAKLRG